MFWLDTAPSQIVLSVITASGAALVIAGDDSTTAAPANAHFRILFRKFVMNESLILLDFMSTQEKCFVSGLFLCGLFLNRSALVLRKNPIAATGALLGLEGALDRSTILRCLCQ